jgi:hypothetical protein
MTDRIKPMGLFATPETLEDLMQYIENFNGGERVAAMTVMGMTWNYLAKEVNAAVQQATDGE